MRITHTHFALALPRIRFQEPCSPIDGFELSCVNRTRILEGSITQTNGATKRRAAKVKMFAEQLALRLMRHRAAQAHPSRSWTKSTQGNGWCLVNGQADRESQLRWRSLPQSPPRGRTYGHAPRSPGLAQVPKALSNPGSRLNKSTIRPERLPVAAPNVFIWLCIQQGQAIDRKVFDEHRLPQCGHISLM